MKKTAQEEIQLISNTLILLTTFQKQCEEKKGNIGILQFLQTRNLGDPYYSIFRNLLKNGDFENLGTKRNPIFTNFKSIDRHRVRIAYDMYVIKYTSKNRKKKLEKDKPKIKDVLEEIPNSQTVKTQLKKSLVVKLFGITIFEKSYK